MFRLLLIRQQRRSVAGVLLCLRLVDKNRRLKASGLAVLKKKVGDKTANLVRRMYVMLPFLVSRVFILFIALKDIS
jgi:hypothetical protein